MFEAKINDVWTEWCRAGFTLLDFISLSPAKWIPQVSDGTMYVTGGLGNELYFKDANGASTVTRSFTYSEDIGINENSKLTIIGRVQSLSTSRGMQVAISSDGGNTWTSLTGRIGSSSVAVWTAFNKEIDLSAYAGKEVKICVYLDTNTNNTSTGVYFTTFTIG